jgi:dienelactone hydrolase
MDRRRWLIRMLGASAAGVCVPTAGAAPPAAAVEDLDWLDPARDRRLPLRLRWPAGEAPCPLLLYSHGLGGSRDGGDAWGRAWRDAGFAVLHVQHPGSDAEVLAGGWAALRRAADARQLLARAADIRFVLDELERRAAEAPWSRLRLDAVGLAGHSFGAVTTLALAGQRYAVPAALAEPRLRAFVAFSPSPARSGRLTLTEQFGAIDRPLLGITGALDGDPLGAGLTPQQRASVVDGLAAGRNRRALLWLADADHMSLAGHAERPIRWAGAQGARPSAAIDAEPRVQRLAARVSTLWCLRYVAGDRMAEMALQGVPRLLGPGDRWLYD